MDFQVVSSVELPRASEKLDSVSYVKLKENPKVEMLVPLQAWLLGIASELLAEYVAELLEEIVADLPKK